LNGIQEVIKYNNYGINLMRRQGLNEARWNMLSNELKVATEIDRIDAAHDCPYFNKVADNLINDLGMKKTTVHSAINRLIDLGTIDAKWEKNDHSWVRRFYLSGENRDFIRNLNKELYS
jgi:hypothetical protein